MSAQSPTARLRAMTVCSGCGRRRHVIVDATGAATLRCTTGSCYDRGVAGEAVVPARTWQALNRAALAERDRYERDVERWCAVSRTKSGAPLTSTPELRRAWRHVCDAKTRPAFARRAAAWLALLADRASDTDRLDDVRPSPTWRAEFGRSDSRSISHLAAPTIRLGERGTIDRYVHGRYTRSLLSGVHEIYIADSDDLDQMRATLLHEACHWLDDVGRTGQRTGHDRLWRARLDRLRGQYPTKVTPH